MKTQNKNISYIIIILFISTFIYLFICYFLEQYYIKGITSKNEIKNNELGDFIGGLLNPLFTLLSTISIIYLTFIISKSEDRRAEKSIETQKKISISQLRQKVIDDFRQKTNLYVYELNKLSAHSVESKFVQKTLTKIIDNKNKENGNNNKITVWLEILNEIDHFEQQKYLFQKLFENKDFNENYSNFIDITSKLCDEQNEYKFVKIETLKEYIELQKKILTSLGNFIYSEF